MPLLLTIICHLVAHVSSEIFTTGVGLLTNSSESGNNSGCALPNIHPFVSRVRNHSGCFQLQKQAADVWRRGGFASCISNPPVSFGLDWQIIPYRITVDSNAFDIFPENEPYVEKYFFVNTNLNTRGKQCMTVTGSNWWIEQTAHSKQQTQ
ncbi:unnamed protein product, partial [Dicrocoelium dendriticum]